MKRRQERPLTNVTLLPRENPEEVARFAAVRRDGKPVIISIPRD